MKTKLMSLIIMGTLVLPVFAEEEAANKGGGLEETVEYEVKEKLEINKAPPSIELNVKEIIESGTPHTDSVIEETRPIPSDEDFNNYAMLDSRQIMTPWNPVLPQPPLVRFNPGLSKVATDRWEFRVSDEGGEVIKTIAGKGVPPRQIDWDGRNERGEYINVGTIYSYNFVTFDEHENAHTFPGEPFNVEAMKYEQKRKLFLEFSNEKLFVENSAVIRPAMKGMWDRAIDVLREHSNRPILLEIFADSTRDPLAEERRQVLVKSISDATNIPSVDIRHSVQKIGNRGDVCRLVLSMK